MKRDLEKVKDLLQSLCVISSHLWAFLLGKTVAKMLNQCSYMQGKEMWFHERKDLLQWKIAKYPITKISSTLQACNILNKNNYPQQVVTLCDSLEGFLLIIFQ